MTLTWVLDYVRIKSAFIFHFQVTFSPSHHNYIIQFGHKEEIPLKIKASKDKEATV